jgi:hypothetical protein
MKEETKEEVITNFSFFAAFFLIFFAFMKKILLGWKRRRNKR